MGRKPKVMPDNITEASVHKMYKCLRCGAEYENPLKRFYKISHSPLYKANDCYAPLCTNCVSELFDEYRRRYDSEKTAFIILAHQLDIPFYHSLFDSIIQNNNTFSVGLYLRCLNNNQYQYQNFSTTLVSGELNKTDTDIRNQKESKWSTSEIRNKDQIIQIIGYDPFDGYSSDDRKYLFGELAKYINNDEDLSEDTFKLSQVIQIVNNNNQIRQYDLQIANLSPISNSTEIKILNEIKSKLVMSNDKIAKENETSVKNRSDKDVGRNTLTFLMKDLREKDFKKAEANFYDQLRSEGTQWAANMSLQAIKENTFFDENDQQEVFNIQRDLITKLQAESDDYKEKYRLALIQIDELKKQVDSLGGDGHG